MKKKIISLCLVIALVATAIAGATLAYFTDTTEVNKNTFSVGDVDIKLDETNTDGGKDDPARDTENKYENIYPNQTVVKDPTVTFEKDSRDCFVRMLVTVNYDKLVAAFPSTEENGYKYADLWEGELFLLEKLVVDKDGECTWEKATWPVANVSYETKNVGTEEEPENVKFATYEFRYFGKKADEKGVISAANAKKDVSLEDLFEYITFPADMTNDEIGALDGFKVDVVAHAMQAESFTNAGDAWTAFDSADKD